MARQDFLAGDETRVYLDHNATTPLAQFLEPKILEWANMWGNPSSIHWSGRGPKALLREARQQVASLIGAKPLEIIFTSGGSESNNLAIKGVFEFQKTSLAVGPRRTRYLVSAVEHPSVTNAYKFLSQKAGAQVDVIPVSRQGEIDLDSYKKMLAEDVAMVSVMYANNETGNIYPIQKMAAMAHKVGALFHCDAVQALGKAVVDVKKWGVDFASFSAHKFYSLKGCGALYAARGAQLEPLIHGGGQERGRRAGTENVLAIAAFGAMASMGSEVEHRAGTMKQMRNKLQQQLLAEVPRVRVTGADSKRVPNTLSLIIDGVDGESLLMNLDLKGFAVSTGAACSSGSPEPSPVLMAMGLTRQEAQSSLRLSLGWGTQPEQLQSFVETLKQVTERLRSFSDSQVGHYGS